MSAVTITDQYNLVATQHETQRKVFKNPRGLGYYYAIHAHDTVGGAHELRMYKSADGITWSLDSTIYVAPGSYIIGSSSLCFVDDGSKTVIHIVYSRLLWDGITSKYLSKVYYRRGTIADASHSISWDAAYEILDLIGEPNPVVTRDANGYIYVAYRRYGLQTQSESKYVDGRPSMVRNGWGATGVSPYIDAIDASIINTIVTNAEMGEFSFGDPSILGEQRYVDVYCSSSDGNDYIEVYVSGDNGANFALAGEVHPGVAIGWLSVDASAILNTGAKLLAAEVYFKKKTVGAPGQSVTIDACKLRVIYLGVTDGWGVEMIASTVTDNPTSVQWSSPEVIQESGVPNSSPYWTAYPTIVPFKSGASRDVWIGVKYYDTVRVATTLMACEYSWDGATFTRGIDEIWKSTSPDHLLSAVVDSSNIVYVAMKDYFLELYTRRWQLGVGWMVLGSSVVTISHPITLSICIDETASPNLIYYFYVATSYGSATNKVTIKTKNTANWNAVSVLIGHYADDSEDIRLFSATDVDNNGYMGLVYTRQPAKPTYAVRFFMYPAPPPPPVVPGKPLISPPHITEPQVARPLIRLFSLLKVIKKEGG